jgi:dihydrofolate synthase/folylpolyglutamate synthase
VLLDAAHNADSSEKLVDAVLKLYPGTRFTVILGIVKGKDVQGMVNTFKKLPADFILTNPHTGKGSALPELQVLARQAGLTIRGIIPELQQREQLPPNCPLLFTGSFFTALIGEELFSQVQ